MLILINGDISRSFKIRQNTCSREGGYTKCKTQNEFVQCESREWNNIGAQSMVCPKDDWVEQVKKD